MISISLDKQIHIYSVDTSSFYFENEIKIHKKLNKAYKLRKKISTIKRRYWRDDKITEGQLKKITKQYSIINKLISKMKDKLYVEFKNNKNNIRILDSNSLNDKNIVSIFESTLTRTLQIKENELSTDIIIVRTYFFDVLKDIILHGFICNNEKYICLTASAGQIRTKKTVFIKENIWNKYKDSITCGLTVDEINKRGGVNINKYLAYLALSNSATDEWKEFDINKTIVVDDMETLVPGIVDFIDDKTYEIERKQMDIPINHTDGCGMILPKLSKKNFMIRLPWVKGLLSVFSFDNFIKEKSEENGNYCGIVKDIYGKEHDILKEDIEIIFTKSQFKMAKYYDSWQQYQENFIKYNCQAGICNKEEDIFENAKINYQMLQTLTDMNNEELEAISKTTRENITNISSDKKTILKVLGVTRNNHSKNYIQQAIEIYPELLKDEYCKTILKQVKRKLVKEARAGRLDIEGKYTFICPDLYAFCEHLFLNEKFPMGLLGDKEVYCKLYRDKSELDCLRSPHLWREHAVRKNIINSKNDEWFITNALYTSCHDIISKILMFDVDGDKSLIVADGTIISVAKRNLIDIVPLYYNMRKANPEIINNNSIYSGLTTAYTGGNIGIISNNITKIWNSKNINLDAIKLLCLENNFTIDYAKTLYKPERPKDKKDMIINYTKQKVPYFFIYAKDKTKEQVEPINNSTVNRLCKIIKNTPLNFNILGIGRFNYKKLMKNKNKELEEKDQTIIEKYNELDLKKHFMINKNDDRDKVGNTLYLYSKIREKILDINSDAYYVTDVLIKYLYTVKQSKYKTTLWECFGDIIVENLKNNIISNFKNGATHCRICGVLIPITAPNKKYCPQCAKEIEFENHKVRNREFMRKKRHSVDEAPNPEKH